MKIDKLGDVINTGIYDVLQRVRCGAIEENYKINYKEVVIKYENMWTDANPLDGFFGTISQAVQKIVCNQRCFFAYKKIY